ncbi:MAG TPA: acyl-CoA dehydrogenase, partial [Pirellulaceae bacterium]|nr:acyl-CoA dehydrogenase [Pirellulaceae bacterium]
SPLGNLSRLGRFTGRKLGALLVAPSVPVRNSELEPEAVELGRLVSSLGTNVERLLVQYQLGIVDRQYQLARVSDAATELYVSTCVLNRLDFLLRNSHDHDGALRLELETGRYYLRTARRRIRQSLAALWDNDDETTTVLANRVLRE